MHYGLVLEAGRRATFRLHQGSTTVASRQGIVDCMSLQRFNFKATLDASDGRVLHGVTREALEPAHSGVRAADGAADGAGGHGLAMELGVDRHQRGGLGIGHAADLQWVGPT